MKQRSAFTLVELLVVIAIIGVLVALLLPAVQAAREAARRTQCANNLKQLSLALHNFESAYRRLPPGATNNNFPHGYPRTTWAVHLYPYLEAHNIYDKFDMKAPGGVGAANWTNAKNCQGASPPTAAPVNAFYCPSDGQGGRIHHHNDVNADFARGNYAGFFGNLNYGAAVPPTTAAHRPAVFGLSGPVRLGEISDGLSNTLAFGEILTGNGKNTDYRGVHWYDHSGASQVFTNYAPNTPNPDVFYAQWCGPGENMPLKNLPCIVGASDASDHTAASRSRHPAGVQAGLCDGSVRFVSQSIDINLWRAAGSIQNGETTVWND